MVSRKVKDWSKYSVSDLTKDMINLSSPIGLVLPMSFPMQDLQAVLGDITMRGKFPAQ